MTVGTAGLGWCLCGVGAAAATLAALVVPSSPVAVPAPDPFPAASPTPSATGAEPRFDVVRVGRGGAAVVAGRAAPGAEVALADATPGEAPRDLGRARADRRGEWVILPAGPLEPGARTLRLRAPGHPGEGSGEASLVVAVPPRGAGGAAAPPPAALAAPAATPASASTPVPALAVVRPGASLWRIAEAAYGHGPLYPRIHRANRDRVRDAHLIHPGQVLVLP